MAILFTQTVLSVDCWKEDAKGTTVSSRLRRLLIVRKVTANYASCAV